MTAPGANAGIDRVEYLARELAAVEHQSWSVLSEPTRDRYRRNAQAFYAEGGVR